MKNISFSFTLRLLYIQEINIRAVRLLPKSPTGITKFHHYFIDKFGRLVEF